MKKIKKHLARRSFALFLALAVSMNLLSLTAFAGDLATDGVESTGSGSESNGSPTDNESSSTSDEGSASSSGSESGTTGDEGSAGSSGSESGTTGDEGNAGSSDSVGEDNSGTASGNTDNSSGNSSDGTDSGHGSNSGDADGGHGSSNDNVDEGNGSLDDNNHNFDDASGNGNSDSQDNGSGNDNADSGNDNADEGNGSQDGTNDDSDPEDGSDEGDSQGSSQDQSDEGTGSEGNNATEGSDSVETPDQAEDNGQTGDPGTEEGDSPVDTEGEIGDSGETQGSDSMQDPGQTQNPDTPSDSVGGSGSAGSTQNSGTHERPEEEADEDEQAIQAVLDAVKAILSNYQNGVYSTDEEMGADADEINAMLDELGDDYIYTDELIKALGQLEEIIGLGVQTLEATDGECTCEYMCTWFWGSYININEECPVCSHATEEQLDPYTYDPKHPENFLCQGQQPTIPGKDPECTHNAVMSGGSLWESWFPGGGSEDLIPATHEYPATDKEAIECMNCGAKWLWSFDPDSEIDPDSHYFGNNKAEIVKEATCSEDGLMVQNCLLCGDVETVIKGGHKKPEDEGQIQITPAGCQDGEIRYSCEICGEEVSEAIPGHHTFPTGHGLPASETGVCTECGATVYEIHTYEDGATPSGHSYGTQYCASVLAEADGTVYGIDKDGSRLDGDSFAIVINHALMGKNKSVTDENGNTVMTRVAGYRNMDDEQAEIYEIGALVPYEAVLDMAYPNGGWNHYYSANDHRTIYLEAIRETVRDDFEVALVPYDPGLSTPDPSLRAHIADTSHSVTVESIYNEAETSCTITYTIPEGYEGDTVSINATKDIMAAYAHLQDTNNGLQPGDTLGPVFIEVVNKSGKDFSYEDNSFVLQSPSHAGKEPYVLPIYTFDGTTPPEASVPSRVSNGALRHLYGVDTDLGDEDLQDDVLAEKLIAKGYENGVADLHQYYLDYYNHFFGSQYQAQWSNLAQVPCSLLIERNEGIFGGHSSTAGLKETNPEVAGVGYSYMYTRLLSVITGDQENRKDPQGEYAVGNHMKDNASYYDGNANYVWGTLASGGSGKLAGMSLYVNGEANDFYQQTAWGIEVGFRMGNTPKPDTPEEPKDPEGPKDPEEPKDPEGPKDPEKPVTPNQPSTTGGGSGGGSGGGNTPSTIPPENVPLANIPDENVPLADIPDDEVPLANIFDENVPLASLPKTGDESQTTLWAMLCLLSMGAMATLFARKKREEP